MLDHHGHDHAHDHGSHHHGHDHAPKDFGRAFVIGIAINLVIVVLGVGFGLWGNSIALLADAGHNFSDVLGLVAAYAASRLAKRPPTTRYTYGFLGSSILAALFNAVFLLAVTGALSWEALQRLYAPAPVAGVTVMIVAGLGILGNGISAALFASGRQGDLNVRGAFLHLAGDTAISAGVVVAGLLIFLTGWLWIDPLVSLAINALIIWSTWSLLRESLAMSLDAVPTNVDAAAVRGYLASLPGVTRLHDLHIWSMGTTETALTAHLVMPGGHPGDHFLAHACGELREHHAIAHVTLQIETSEDYACALMAEDRV